MIPFGVVLGLIASALVFSVFYVLSKNKESIGFKPQWSKSTAWNLLGVPAILVIGWYILHGKRTPIWLLWVVLFPPLLHGIYVVVRQKHGWKALLMLVVGTPLAALAVFYAMFKLYGGR